MRLRLAGAGLVVLDVLLVASLWSDLVAGPIGVIAAVALIAVVVLVLGSFVFVLQIRTDVADGVVGLALWPYWRIRLRVSDLSSRGSTTSPRTWHGIGLRRGHGPRGQLYRALLFDAGPAVLLLDNASGVTYVVRCDHPDRLLLAMRRGARPHAEPPPPAPSLATEQPPVDPALAYPATFLQLQSAIPRVGGAATVQGELLRVLQNLEDEARRNGNQNWDDRHRAHLDYLRRHLADGTLPESRTTILAELGAIAHGGSPQTDPAVWTRLIDWTCEWAIAHPTPLDRGTTDAGGDDDPAGAHPDDGVGADAQVGRLREVVGAWAHGLVPSSAVVLAAAELVAETDDSTSVPIAALPLTVERADLWPVIRDVLTAAGEADVLDDEQLRLLALAWLCRRYLAAEIPGVRVTTWVGTASRATAPGPFEAFAELGDAIGSGLARDRFERELRDRAAAFLLGRSEHRR